MDQESGLSAFAPAFLGLASNLLVDRIVVEGATYARRTGVSAPVRAMSSLMLLDQGAMTVTELAAALGMTHAGAIKASRQLIDAGLVERMADPGDRRRKPLGLTREGRKSAAEARRFIELARHAYVALFEEIGVDLYSAIQAMNAALDRQGFDQRLAEAAAQIARTTPQA